MATWITSFKLLGAKELERAFDQLPKAVQKPILQRVLKEAALPVVATASRMAPRGHETHPHLADSITASTQLSRRQRRQRQRRNQAEIFVGPRVPHAHLVEFGTGPRYQANGKFVGQMPAHPFMRPAWEQNKDVVIQIINDGVWKHLSAAAKRLRRTSERYMRKLGG